MVSKRILIVAPYWVGDMLMGQGLIRLLKQNDPDCLIDVLASHSTYPLLQFMPEVNKGVLLALKDKKMPLIKRWRLAQEIKKEKYDQVILLKNTIKSAFIPWLAGIPTRTGWLGEQRFLLLNDIRRLDKKKYPKMVNRFYALGLPKKAILPHNLPLPKLEVTQKDKESVLKKFNLTKKNSPLLVLCPGSESGVSKQWPAEYFGQLALLCAKLGWQIWIVSGPKDQAVAKIINDESDNNCINLVGKTTLDEAVVLIALADKVVANDTGLMHVAAALDKPLVAVFGSSSPEHTPPLSLPNKAHIISRELPCKPCFKPKCPLTHFQCMRSVLPNDVLIALKGLK